MQSYKKILDLESQTYTSEEDYDEEEPLLSQTEYSQDDYDEDEEEPFPSEFLELVFTDEEPSNIPKREPFLVEEIKACIELLEQIQKNITPEYKKIQRSHYSFNFLCALCIFAAFGTAAVSGEIIYFTLRFLQARVNEKFAPKIKALNDELDSKELEKEEEYKEQKRIEKECIKYVKPIREVENEIERYLSQWFKMSEEGNSCVSWISEGRRQYLNNLFPGLNGYNFCWFKEKDKTHPIQLCNDILDELCTLQKEETKLFAERAPCDKAKRDIQSAIVNTTKEIYGLQSKIKILEFEMQEKNPNMLGITTIVIISVFVIVFVMILIIEWIKSRGDYVEQKKNHYNFIGGTQEAEVRDRITDLTIKRGIDLTSRVGETDFHAMTTQELIAALKIELNEAQLRRAAYTSFLAGGHPRVAAGTTIQNVLFDNDSDRDVSHMIMQYVKAGNKK